MYYKKSNDLYVYLGLAGSVLETKSVNSNPPSWCEHTYDWKHTWVDIPSFLPYNIECLFHILKIGFDKQTNQFFNQKGVLVRPKDFGGVKGIDYLDNGLLGSQPLFGYFAPFITALKGAGYEVGKNLFGIPVCLFYLKQNLLLNYIFSMIGDNIQIKMTSICQ